MCVNKYAAVSRSGCFLGEISLSWMSRQPSELIALSPMCCYRLRPTCPGQVKILLLRLLRCSGQVSINTSSLASKHRRRGQSGLAVSPYIPHSQQVTSPLRISSSLGCFLRKWPGFLYVMLVYLHFKNLGLDLFRDFVQRSEVIKIRAKTLSESLATLLKIPHIRLDLVDGDSVTSFAKASRSSSPVCLWRAVTQNS